MALPLRFLGPWSADHGYAAGSVASDGGTSYLCTHGTPRDAGAPGDDPAHWTLFCGVPVPKPAGYAHAVRLVVTAPEGTGLGGSLSTPSTPTTTDYVVRCLLNGSRGTSVNNGILSSTGAAHDVTIWYDTGEGLVQIDREQDNTFAGLFPPPAFCFWFKLQAPISAGQSSPSAGAGSYILAYGNSSPVEKEELANIWPFFDNFPGSFVHYGDVTKWGSSVVTGTDPTNNHLNVGFGVLTEQLAHDAGTGLATWTMSSIPTFDPGYHLYFLGILPQDNGTAAGVRFGKGDGSECSLSSSLLSGVKWTAGVRESGDTQTDQLDSPALDTSVHGFNIYTHPAGDACSYGVLGGNSVVLTHAIASSMNVELYATAPDSGGTANLNGYRIRVRPYVSPDPGAQVA